MPEVELDRLDAHEELGDHEGGQRTISRFPLIPVGDDRWLASVARHWNLDRPSPAELSVLERPGSG
jgi:hypothetical protein